MIRTKRLFVNVEGYPERIGMFANITSVDSQPVADISKRVSSFLEDWEVLGLWRSDSNRASRLYLHHQSHHYSYLRSAERNRSRLHEQRRRRPCKFGSLEMK